MKKQLDQLQEDNRNNFEQGVSAISRPQLLTSEVTLLLIRSVLFQQGSG